MSIAEMLVPEFETEMANTRKALERVPESKLDWKPDPKSMSMTKLASHIAQMAGWATETMTMDSLDIAPGGKQAFEIFKANSRQQLLDEFDKNVKRSRAAIAGGSDQAMMQNWALLNNGQTIFNMPR